MMPSVGRAGAPGTTMRDTRRARRAGRVGAGGRGVSVRVRILGDFAVTHDGAPIRLASRRASQLVKLLALAGGAAPLDVVVEALWPGDAPGAGQRRLRNVLSRLRQDVPDLVVRHHDDL